MLAKPGFRADRCGSARIWNVVAQTFVQEARRPPHMPHRDWMIVLVTSKKCPEFANGLRCMAWGNQGVRRGGTLVNCTQHVSFGRLPMSLLDFDVLHTISRDFQGDFIIWLPGLNALVLLASCIAGGAAERP